VLCQEKKRCLVRIRLQSLNFINFKLN
jgi:hypothetical protein